LWTFGWARKGDKNNPQACCKKVRLTGRPDCVGQSTRCLKAERQPGVRVVPLPRRVRVNQPRPWRCLERWRQRCLTGERDIPTAKSRRTHRPTASLVSHKQTLSKNNVQTRTLLKCLKSVGRSVIESRLPSREMFTDVMSPKGHGDTGESPTAGLAAASQPGRVE